MATHSLVYDTEIEIDHELFYSYHEVRIDYDYTPANKEFGAEVVIMSIMCRKNKGEAFYPMSKEVSQFIGFDNDVVLDELAEHAQDILYWRE